MAAASKGPCLLAVKHKKGGSPNRDSILRLVQPKLRSKGKSCLPVLSKNKREKGCCREETPAIVVQAHADVIKFEKGGSQLTEGMAEVAKKRKKSRGGEEGKNHFKQVGRPAQTRKRGIILNARNPKESES